MLLMLAAFPTTLASSRESDAWDKSRCPAWLSQYEQWHATTKGTAGAKYLIADAPGFVGVGDHLRGFMFALRVAAATDRVLLLRWEHPGNLTDFLVPGSSIDWASWEGTPAPALLTADKNLKQSDGNKLVMGNNDLGKLFPGALTNTCISHSVSPSLCFPALLSLTHVFGFLQQTFVVSHRCKVLQQRPRRQQDLPGAQDQPACGAKV